MANENTFSPEGFISGLDAASSALTDFANGAAKNSTDTIGKSFDKLGDSISHSLARAAQKGELSFKNMTAAIIRDLQNFALREYITKPLENALSNIFKSIGNGSNSSPSGARASGGRVTAGGAYLVGENGPEYFIPNQSGNIENGASNPINIHIHMNNQSQLSEVRQSAGQVANALARAVIRGQNLL